MKWAKFYRNKHELFCNICCSEFIGDIIEDTEMGTDEKINQICEALGIVEAKKEHETIISVLKFYRKINHVSEMS